MRASSLHSVVGPYGPIPQRGDLAEHSAQNLIRQICETKFSGNLCLGFQQKKKKLWFFEGRVFKIQSNLIPELIGQMMVDRKWLSSDDLRNVLKIQKQSKNSVKIGEIINDLLGIDEDEVHALVEQQMLFSLIQSLTWAQGNFELQSLDLNIAPDETLKIEDAYSVLDSLMQVSTYSSDQDLLLDSLDLWQPSAKKTEVSRTPVWLILASARKLGLSGILYVQRSSKLYEIVLKYGVPLTLYEGSLQEPRQTIVVRQASSEHEKFFTEQLYKLFSFLTGSVSFKALSDSREEMASELQFKDETAVTKSISPDELPGELREKRKFNSFWNNFSRSILQFISNLKVFLSRYLQKSLKSLPKIKQSKLPLKTKR